MLVDHIHHLSFLEYKKADNNVHDIRLPLVVRCMY